MNKVELMREAHKMTREMKSKYPEVDYKFQLGLCIKYLLNKKEDESKMKPILNNYTQKGLKNYLEIIETIDFEEDKLKEVNKRKRTRLLNKDMLIKGIINQLKEIGLQRDDFTYIFEVNYLLPESYCRYNDCEKPNSTKAIISIHKDNIKIDYERSYAKIFSGTFAEYQALWSDSCRYLTHIFDEKGKEIKLSRDSKMIHIFKY